jgi:hypothetical protein
LNRDDRRDPDDREGRGEEELKPLTRDELKQRAIDHVRNLEKKALQEQNKYADSAHTTRDKGTTGTSRIGSGGETEKTSTARGR